MAYIASTNISVFPSTKRGDTQRSARLISEENLVNIVNKLVDRDSFVISFDESNEELEIVIHGYYFHITSINSLLNSLSGANQIYANIVTETNTDEYTDLVGQDNDGNYEGLVITADAPDTSNLMTGQIRYSMSVLLKINNSWVVDEENIVKYNTSRLFGTVSIDGGEI